MREGLDLVGEVVAVAGIDFVGIDLVGIDWAAFEVDVDMEH